MNTETIYDIAGIGIGPFNLGLAALCQPIKEVNTVFFEQKHEFNWHEGMMIPGTTLQVSYLADLVTLADPSSKFSYLSFLRTNNRLLQFGIHEQHYLSRSEYNRYCKWVCSKLDNLVFNATVIKTEFIADNDLFEIEYCQHDKIVICYARHIIAGTGTAPKLPPIAKDFYGDKLIHSSSYMYNKSTILQSKKVMLIGSGQSAAEIFYDLLNESRNNEQYLSWCIRSDRFYAMEHTKLTYEMSTPEYIDYFFNLDYIQKSLLSSKQQLLYKGINYQLINAIYDKLYNSFIEGYKDYFKIHTSLKLIDITRENNFFKLNFEHRYLNKEFTEDADFVILATGYENKFPSFLNPVKHLLQVDQMGQFIVNRNYSVDDNNRVFVQNAEMRTHGFNAADLGLGPYRNAVIINAILGYDYYPVDSEVAFQKFGLAG